MATIINSGTTALTITPDTTGQLALQANGVTALTANTTGYLNFAKQPTIGGVEWPAFSAYITGTQTASSDTATKIALNGERFDTASCYNTTTYRFTPNVAGYYLVTASCYYSSYSGGGFVNIAIYKNGSNFQELSRVNPNSTYGTLGGACLVYLNGTTDYIENYWYSASGSSVLVGNNGETLSHFDAVLIRSA